MAAKELVVKMVILITGVTIGFALGIGLSLWFGLPVPLTLILSFLASLAATATLWIGIGASYGPPRSYKEPLILLALLFISLFLIFLILLRR